MLRYMGNEVVTSRTGEDGIEHYRRKPFDIVITDMRMPGISGSDVIAAIRQIDPHARIIASEGSLSADPMGSGGPRHIPGTSGRLQKPYSVDALTAEIAKVMGGQAKV